MVAHMHIQNENRNIPQEQLDEQQQPNWEVLNDVLLWVLQPLTCIQYPRAKSGYYIVLCADGNFRSCNPGLTAWLADCTEYSTLHHLK